MIVGKFGSQILQKEAQKVPAAWQTQRPTKLPWRLSRVTRHPHGNPSTVGHKNMPALTKLDLAAPIQHIGYYDIELDPSHQHPPRDRKNERHSACRQIDRAS